MILHRFSIASDAARPTRPIRSTGGPTIGLALRNLAPKWRSIGERYIGNCRNYRSLAPTDRSYNLGLALSRAQVADRWEPVDQREEAAVVCAAGGAGDDATRSERVDAPALAIQARQNVIWAQGIFLGLLLEIFRLVNCMENNFWGPWKSFWVPESQARWRTSPPPSR